MANEFDDAVSTALQGAPAPAPLGSPQGSTAPTLDAAQAARVGTAAAVGTNPDLEAELRRVSEQTGVPISTARALPEEIKRQAALGSIDFEGLAATAPSTAKLLADVDRARLAHDDVDNLSSVEKLVRAAVDLGKYAVSAPGAPGGGLMSDVARAARGIGSGIPSAGAGMYGAAAAPFELLGADTIGGFLRDQQQQSDAVAKRWLNVDPDAGLVQRGVMSGLQSAGQNLITMPLGFAKGAAVTGEQLMLSVMGLITGGQSYGKGRDAGLSPARAIPYAAEDAAAEVITEKYMGAAGLLKQVQAGASAAKLFMYELAKEVPGEMAATLWQNFNEWANVNPHKPLADFITEQPAALAETAIATMVGGGALIGTVHVVERAVDSARDEGARSQKAAEASQTLQQIMQAVATSKLRERAPDEFKRFIADVTDGQGDLYIDPETLANTLNQAGIGQEKLAAISPSALEQMRAADYVPGADVRIPLSELIAAGPDLAGPLIPHLRTHPEAMSQAEAAAYMEGAGPALQQEVEHELNRHVTQDQGEINRSEVQRYFEGELANVGRFRPDVNKAYASLLSNFYATQAERAGLTAPELLRRYGLRVTASDLGGEQTLLAGENRAALNFGHDISKSPSVIALMQGADLTSFLHESGHFFLEVQADLAGKIQQAINAGESVGEGERGIAADMNTALAWMGVPDLSTWHEMTLDQKREAHERWARGFERYVMEGVAPSTEMQSLFGRMRAWLISVYKSLSALKVEISDDVRQVMNRMLASDAKIAEAEAARAMGPLFKSAEQAGMTLDEYHEYQALAAQATAAAQEQLDAALMRDMRWLSKARHKAIRAAQLEAGQARRAIEREVRAMVLAEPIYQAWQFLTGKAERVLPGTAAPEAISTLQSGKLRTSRVKEIDPKIYKALSDLGMTSEERGLDPDIVAEINGINFKSGEQLVRALYLAEPPEQVIEGMTDQRMLETYGDISSPQALNRAADQAVHNELRARVIATELKALTHANTVREKRGAGTVDVMARAARDFANQVIARQKIKDVRPAKYAAAEARASRQAERSLGDTAKAAEYKRNALVNNFATKAAYEAGADVRKGLDYLRRVDASTSLPAEYADQVHALLERYDLRTSTTDKQTRRRQSLAEWVQSQQEMGIEPDVPDYLMRDAQLVSYRELTVEEFRGLVDTVRQIEHLGRLKGKLLAAKDQREFAIARDDIVRSIIAHAGTRQADTRTANTTAGAAIQSLRRFWASHIKAATLARVMDGGKDGGPVWEYLIRTANASGDKELTMRAQATQDAAALLQPVLKLGKMGGKGTYFQTIDRALNREARLAVALNAGNESNLQRLLDGEGWSQERIRPVLESLTSTEWHFVQGVWDYFESYRPEIAAKERRVMGREPEWIAPKPFKVTTADGQELELRGGYYPVKYDPRASERAEAHQEAEAAKQAMKGAYTSATTRRSFTKARAEEVHGRPLLYSLDGLYNGVQEVIHDLAWHEFLIDANRLIRDKGIAAAMRQHYGPESHQQMKRWLEDIAVGERGAQHAGEEALAWIRQGVSVSALGLNVMSALIQPLGITQSITRIGSKWVGRGLVKFIGGPMSTADEINTMSAFMRTRNMTRLRELAEVRAQVKGQTQARHALDGAAYYLMLRAQQSVDLPTWWGAYEKATAEGNDQARAVALADQAVIDSQGSGTIKDQSAIERGGPALKLFTTFYSFFNVTLNNGVVSTMTQESKAKIAGDYLLLFVVPVILGALLKDALTPGDAGDDDPRKLAKRLIGEEISFLFGLMFGVREISGAAQAVTGTAQYGTDYSGPSGVRPIADLAKLGQQVHQGEMDDSLRRAIIRTAGELLRLPAAQVNRSIDGARALAGGKTSNPAALVFGYQEPH